MNLTGPQNTSYQSAKRPRHDSIDLASSGSRPSIEREIQTKQKRSANCCDLCRARKVKCFREPGSSRCRSCAQLHQPCVATPRERPGRRSKFALKTTPSPSTSPTQAQFSLPNNPPLRSNEALPGLDTWLSSSIDDNPTEPLRDIEASGWATRWDESRPTLPSFADVTEQSRAAVVFPFETLNDNPAQLPAMDRFHTVTTPAAVKLDDVVDLGTVMRILQSYRTHLYALMPIIHWPTFLQLVASREDERVLHFRAFLFSLIAYTIIQLPRSALSFLPVPVLRQLHQRSYAASKSLLDLRQENVRATLLEVSTLYCHHIYLSTIDDVDRARGVLAQAIRLAQVLDLHNETTTVTDVIEAEIRRRVFWLLYGSDQTMSAYSSLPPLIQTIDIAVPLPAIVDDNHIGSTIPADPAPLLSGFHFNARLFRIIGDIHTAKRDLKGISTIHNRLPLGIGAFHLPPPQHFLNQLDRFIWDLPPRLRPVAVPPTQDVMDLVAPAATPPNSEEEDDHGFATCRTNLIVTLALTRYMVRQYAILLGQEDFNREANTHWAEDHIISLLKRMPPDSLVANGEALRHKLLHLAFALLETFPASSESHTFLSDSVEVLSRISREQLAGLLEPNPM